MLAGKTKTGFVSVILKTSAPLSAAQEARITALGATVVRHLSIIQSVSVRLPERSLARLAALPFAAHLSYDGCVTKCDAFTAASSGAGYACQQYGLTGQGVGVAIVDSGIRYCSDLDVSGSGTSRVRAAISFVPGSTSTDDLCGHGTHVAGIVGGNGAASTGPGFSQTFYGVARGANLINVRVLDQNGASTVSTVISGLQWVLSNRKTYNIRVVNLSLGHPVGESYTTDPVCQAVESLYKNGIVVVCAAGNEGRVNNTVNTPGLDNEGWGTNYGSIQSPGNDPYVITVGATKSIDGLRADDKIATYSSRGPSRLDLVIKPDIIAPGNKVISLYSYNSTLFQYDSANGNNLPAKTSRKRPGPATLPTTSSCRARAWLPPSSPAPPPSCSKLTPAFPQTHSRHASCSPPTSGTPPTEPRTPSPTAQATWTSPPHSLPPLSPPDPPQARP